MPNNSADRLTALIDEVEDAATHRLIAAERGTQLMREVAAERSRTALAALRAEAASVQERLARAEAERNEMLGDLARMFPGSKWADRVTATPSDVPACASCHRPFSEHTEKSPYGPPGSILCPPPSVTGYYRPATTPEGNHAK